VSGKSGRPRKDRRVKEKTQSAGTVGDVRLSAASPRRPRFASGCGLNRKLPHEKFAAIERQHTIDKPDVTVDPNDQLSIKSNSPTTAVTRDVNTVRQVGTYKVTAHAEDGTAISCDPGIINH